MPEGNPVESETPLFETAPKCPALVKSMFGQIIKGEYRKAQSRPFPEVGHQGRQNDDRQPKPSQGRQGIGQDDERQQMVTYHIKSQVVGQLKVAFDDGREHFR
ncbi:MAG: hypothetical protein WAU91_07930, partial [Desulfatitalea sp.]